jgi:hydroxypyruvate isomerase
MERREFLRAGVAALAGACWSAQPAADESNGKAAHGRFQLNYAPHFGMFKHSAGDDLSDQLKFAADQGFTAWEDDGLRARPVDVQEKIARTLNSLGMDLGAFAAMSAFPDAVSARKHESAWESRLQELRNSVQVAKRVNARWMTVALGGCEADLGPGGPSANCVELLKRCCAILEPLGLILVLEPPSRRDGHPGELLPKTRHTYQICQAVGSPSCKMLYDVYYQHLTEGNLIPNMEAAWGEMAYVRCGDNPGRKEPGTGEIDYRQVFAHLRFRGYTGMVGMHHGNSKPGPEGEQAVIDAYVAVERAWSVIGDR